MRAVIAKRLTESKQNSPHGHATISTNADAILRLRKDFASAGIKLSVNDFIIKAAGTALQYVPEINMNIKGDDFQVEPSNNWFLLEIVQ
jgi:pyruvate dehydrogenase E2 component (dihydrolipoamide acetyltransferase)